jgi:hypothetical protein
MIAPDRRRKALRGLFERKFDGVVKEMQAFATYAEASVGQANTAWRDGVGAHKDMVSVRTTSFGQLLHVGRDNAMVGEKPR